MIESTYNEQVAFTCDVKDKRVTGEIIYTFLKKMKEKTLAKQPINNRNLSLCTNLIKIMTTYPKVFDHL